MKKGKIEIDVVEIKTIVYDLGIITEIVGSELKTLIGSEEIEFSTKLSKKYKILSNITDILYVLAKYVKKSVFGEKDDKD